MVSRSPEDAEKKARPYSFFRGRRDRAERVDAVDARGSEHPSSIPQPPYGDMRREVERLYADLIARNGAQPLISPLELRTVDRYVLEDRCRALTNPVYLGNNTALCRVLGFYKMYLDTRDTGFASNLLLDGYWEMWLTIFLARQVQTGMTVMDVGANFGYYTLLFGSLVGPEGHVFAVEPNPEIVPKLQRTIRLNGLAARTTLIAAAAGAAEGGESSLFVPEGEPKNGTITEFPEWFAAGSGTVHKVPRIRLGGLAEARRIDLIKIDAEGAEEDIITGMEETLRRDRPALLLEFNPDRYRDAGAFLRRLGAIYDRVRYVDFKANAIDGDPATILNDRSGEDWLLFFDRSPTDARAVDGASAVQG